MFSRSQIPSYALQLGASTENDQPSAHDPQATAALLPQGLTTDHLDLAHVSPSRPVDDQQALRRKKSLNLLSFPAPSIQSAATTSKHPRYSLPLGQPPKKVLPARPDRKSLSPRHASIRTSNPGTLLSTSIETQYHSLRARNSKLQMSNSSMVATHQGELLRAKKRIESLEKAMEGVAMERDGWESEATRLNADLEAIKSAPPLPAPSSATAMEVEVSSTVVQVDEGVVHLLEAEVDSLRGNLERETSKRRKYKDVNEKLRCELENRRLKEKWDLGIMDVEDRKTQAGIIVLEFEVAELRMRVDLSNVDREELVESLHSAQETVRTLTAARTILLGSYNTSQSALSQARAELVSLRNSASHDQALSTSLSADLARSKAALVASQKELKDTMERCEEFELVVDRFESEVAGVDKVEAGRTKALEREMVKMKKALTEEVEKRETAEAETLLHKTTLKATQMELKSSEKELVAANRSVELANKSAEIAQTTLQAAISSFAAASTSVVKTVAPKVKASKLTAPLIVKERKRKSLTVEPIAGDDEESEVEAPLPVAVKPATKPRAKKVVAPIVAEPTVDSDSQDDGAFYRPSKPKTRISLGSASAPSRAASLAPASPVAVVKKAKIAKVKAVLAEKSTNAKSVEKVKMVAAKEKGKGKRAAEVVEEDVEEPAKKKKTKLFLGARQFTWDKFVPSTDVTTNSLGLPTALSPIKASSTRPSLGTIGKGLNGRKSIFSL